MSNDALREALEIGLKCAQYVARRSATYDIDGHESYAEDVRKIEAALAALPKEGDDHSGDATVMVDKISKDALSIYKPPFRFIHGYIQDAASHTVADHHDGELRVRGWGRISYMPDAEKIQDAIGEHIAKALTDYWNHAAQPKPTAVAATQPYNQFGTDY